MGLLNWLGQGATMLKETIFAWGEATNVYLQSTIDIIFK